ncbi:MAG: hypothetical protein HY913_22890 [Desulfomonile tiedjei]|nr:hypothetical protein [Desulfomonile tiedjei]
MSLTSEAKNLCHKDKEGMGFEIIGRFSDHRTRFVRLAAPVDTGASHRISEAPEQPAVLLV